MNDGPVFDFDAALDLFHKSSLKYVKFSGTISL